MGGLRGRANVTKYEGFFLWMASINRFVFYFRLKMLILGPFACFNGPKSFYLENVLSSGKDLPEVTLSVGLLVTPEAV